MKEQLTVLVNFDEQALDEVVNTANVTTDVDPIFFKRIDELVLFVRASNCLESASITYLGELVQKTENGILYATSRTQYCTIAKGILDIIKKQELRTMQVYIPVSFIAINTIRYLVHCLRMA